MNLDFIRGEGRPGWAQPLLVHDRRPYRARPPVVLVAHGSPDPRSRATVRAVAAAAGATAAFLDFDAPDPVTALTALADAGHRHAVLVPLLLTNAYHGRVDVPRIAAAAAEALPNLAVATTAPVGGPHLLAALLRAVADAADDPTTTVVHEPAELAVGRAPTVGTVDERLNGRRTDGFGPLDGPSTDRGFGPAGFDALVFASAGTRDVATLDSLTELAARLGRAADLPVRAAYASAAKPSVPRAVAELRERGHRRVAVVSYFIAPGVLHDRVATAAIEAGAAVTPPLGACPELVAAITGAAHGRNRVLRHYRASAVENHRVAPSSG